MLDYKEKEEKKCYGLDIPVEGKPKWVYENPYRYVEKQGCKPVDDYFGYNSFSEDEDIAIEDPLFINKMQTLDYNLMFYNPTGFNFGNPKNRLASAFCHAYEFKTPQYSEKIKQRYIKGSMIILLKHKRFFNQSDKKQLVKYLKDLDWFVGE